MCNLKYGSSLVLHNMEWEIGMNALGWTESMLSQHYCTALLNVGTASRTKDDPDFITVFQMSEFVTLSSVMTTASAFYFPNMS
mgnify:CR=1 FL=1